MLRCYIHEKNKLKLAHPTGEAIKNAIWFDLLDATESEDRLIEEILQAEVPTQEDMKEIELSSRLYQEDGATYMIITILSAAEMDEPVKSQVTFILKENQLVTVRHTDPSPFKAFRIRSQKSNGIGYETGEHVMLGILEAVIDRTADIIEGLSDGVEAASRDVFRKKSSNATKNAGFLQSVIENIGRKADILSMVLESLISISRLTTYHSANPAFSGPAHKEVKQLLKAIQRDALALSEHAGFISGKISFLLDSTLGLINLEQNQIIKIFSIASVIFLPPTMIASIYGMNFDIMPELKWSFG